MKKRILTILLALALLCALGGTALGSVRETTEALTYRNITVLLDGKTLVPVDAEGNGVEPFILDASGSTYLPVRAIGYALGLGVDWDGATNTVILTSGGEVKNGSGEPLKSSRAVTAGLTYRDIRITLDGVELVPKDAEGNIVEPFILNENGTTYLPVRGVGSALGLEVGWDGATNTVTLTSGGQGVGSTEKPKQDIEQWKITYQNYILQEDIRGEVELYAIVEVENTGTVDLYLKDATFDFEDDAGHLVATYSSWMISCDPEIIAPGEKGYFYCNMVTLSGDIDVNAKYNFVPNLKIEKSKNDIIRYEISDTSITKGEGISPVTIIGRITNNTEKRDGLVWIAIVLFREDNTPIAAFGTNVTDLGAGEQTSFDASAVYLMNLDFEYSEISRYEVYACKTQYQF